MMESACDCAELINEYGPATLYYLRKKIEASFLEKDSEMQVLFYWELTPESAGDYASGTIIPYQQMAIPNSIAVLT